MSPQSLGVENDPLVKNNPEYVGMAELASLFERARWRSKNTPHLAAPGTHLSTRSLPCHMAYLSHAIPHRAIPRLALSCSVVP